MKGVKILIKCERDVSITTNNFNIFYFFEEKQPAGQQRTEILPNLATSISK